MNILLVLLISLVFVLAFIIIPCYKSEIRNLSKSLRNNVHFYVARDKDGDLNLFINKPSRSYNLNKWKQYNFYKLGGNKHKWIATRIVEDDYFKDLGLNPTDFKNLKFEDEPVEVFLNLEN